MFQNIPFLRTDMTRLQRIVLYLLCVSFLLITPLSALAARPDPTEQMKPFVEKITRMIAEADLKNDADCNFCKRLIDVSRERFDFREMSKRVLGKSWRKLSKKEKEQFTDLFTDLLQYAYIGKIENYADQKIVFKQQRIKGNRAEVKTELVDREKSIPVSYIMILKGDQWMVYDVVVEGVSLIRNYMEQFRRIIRKDGYQGLVEQIKAKIKELEEARNRKAEEQAG